MICLYPALSKLTYTMHNSTFLTFILLADNLCPSHPYERKFHQATGLHGIGIKMRLFMV